MSDERQYRPAKFETLEDYMRDHAERKRKNVMANIPRGSGHKGAKLTEMQVIEIRQAYYSGSKTTRELSAAYGISKSNLGSLLTGASWAHVKEGLEQYEAEKSKYRTPEEVQAWKKQRKERNLAKAADVSAKLTADQVRAIRAEYVPGNGKEIAAKYGTKQATVSNIITGKTWKNLK